MLDFINSEKRLKFFLFVEFLSFFSGYLILPILAIFLNQKLSLSLFKVGVLLTIPSILTTFLGVISQISLLKIGRFRTIYLGMILEIIFFIGVVFKWHFVLLLLLAIIQGIGRSLWIPLFKSTYIILLKNKNHINITFKLRYILICVAAIFAPLLSPFLYEFNSNIIFYIVLSFYLVQILLLEVNYNGKINDIKKEGPFKKQSLSLFKNINFLLKDKIIITYIIGVMLSLTVFSQFESTFSLTLFEKTENPERIFSVLLILNSVLGIVLQFIEIYLFKNVKSIHSLIIGAFFFSLAFLLFAQESLHYIVLFITMLFFTIGETLILPNMEIIINDITVDENRDLVYGFAEIKRAGFFLGPLISSFLLGKFSAQSMFYVFFYIAVLSLTFFLLLNKMIHKKSLNKFVVKD